MPPSLPPFAPSPLPSPTETTICSRRERYNFLAEGCNGPARCGGHCRRHPRCLSPRGVRRSHRPRRRFNRDGRFGVGRGLPAVRHRPGRGRQHRRQRPQLEELHRRGPMGRGARETRPVLPDSVRPQRRAGERARARDRSEDHLPREHGALRRRARAIGAKPILVTSLVRRLYKEDGTIRTTQTPYVEVVRALAAEKKVPLVDLHAISLADAENAGDDVWADLSPRDDKGQVDRTHLNAKGSEVVGRMVVEALRKAFRNWRRCCGRGTVAVTPPATAGRYGARSADLARHTSRCLHPPQLLNRAPQRPPALAHVRPQVADLGDARGHRPQRERLRADVAALDLLPRARRRHRRAGLRRARRRRRRTSRCSRCGRCRRGCARRGRPC